MNIHDEFQELLSLLVGEGAEFAVVGGYAVAFHGFVRATRDLDLFFRPTEENALRVIRALIAFDLPLDESSVDEFLEPGAIIRIGSPPVQVELINAISGVDFQEVWSKRTSAKYGDVSIPIIGREDLIKNKQASGRPRDRMDLDELGE